MSMSTLLYRISTARQLLAAERTPTQIAEALGITLRAAEAMLASPAFAGTTVAFLPHPSTQ